MLMMASGGFGVTQVAGKLPDSFWAAVAPQLQHAAWIGCAAWDLIMPGFLLIVGVAMPYSYARRQAEGHSFARQFRHAVGRAIVLVLLGLMLYTQRERSYVFTNVLAQIGLAYAFAFLVLGRGWRWQVGAVAAILVGDWLLFALYPPPGPDFDFAKVGVTRADLLPGLWAHWTKNANVAAAFDQWFLNLLPQAKPFVFNNGGYQTLNFVPSIATIILGIMAGDVLRGSRSPRAKAAWLAVAGAVCMALGVATGWTVCPIIKRLWTPSWVLFSGAWTLWLLAAFYWVIDVWGWRRWAFPLVVVGMNSIAIYLMAQLWSGWIASNLKTHLGPELFSGTWGPVVQKCSVLAVLWLCCGWLYRRKIFLKI